MLLKYVPICPNAHFHLKMHDAGKQIISGGDHIPI